MNGSDPQSREEQVVFKADEYQLAATLYAPIESVHGTVIGCHGLLSDRTSPKQIELAKNCAQLGLAYLAIDHRGCGDSEGEFQEVTTLPNRKRDLLAAVSFIQTQTPWGSRLGLFGSSMGGAVCLAAFARIQPFAIVTVPHR